METPCGKQGCSKLPRSVQQDGFCYSFLGQEFLCRIPQISLSTSWS
jgi:hypothetical protein